MTQENSAKLAVLIDADNASADIVEPLLEEIAKYGIASVKRIYGDWSSGLIKWRDALLPHAITPIQQFAYTKGKNATDMAMVIDGMDLLYSNTFNGFCIVSSDSDFTRLASRIRENGLTVYGFGQKKTPESFRKACDKFIYTENLGAGEDDSGKDKNKTAAGSKRKTVQELKQDSALLNLFRNAVKEHADDEGWASLGVVGQYINKVNSDFDSRNYGYSKLSGLVRALGIFETQPRGSHLWLRSKNRKPTQETGQPAAGRAGLPEKPVASHEIGVAGKTGRQQKKTSNAAAHPSISASEAVGSEKPAVLHFRTLIPILQNGIGVLADDQGWIGLGKLFSSLKATNPQFKAQNYSFDSFQAIVAKIYDEWLEKRKVGLGMRIRINKRYPGTGE